MGREQNISAILEGLYQNRITKSNDYVIEEKEKYSKEDLVEFLKWNSNAPVSILKKASKEDLEEFMSKGGEKTWNKFFETLPKYREMKSMEKQINATYKKLGIK